MRTKHVRSLEELFTSASTKWKRVSGTLPPAKIEAGLTAIVRSNGKRANLPGWTTSCADRRPTFLSQATSSSLVVHSGVGVEQPGSGSTVYSRRVPTVAPLSP